MASQQWAQRGTVRYMSSAYINLDGHTSIDIAREIDANLTLVSFTGTTGRRERWKWKAIESFIQRAHEAGIKVSTYMKTTNLNWKPMFHERPESKDWIMLCADGTPALYGSSHERYMGCVNNPGWRRLLKEMIEEAVKLDVDGLFYDNHFIPSRLAGAETEGFFRSWACYCDVCREQFAAYTQDTVGWPCDIPPEPDWDDPVWQAFIDFRDDSLVDVTRMIVEHAKQLKPEIVVYPNVCPPWFSGGGAKGSATTQIADVVDILLFEGNTQPRMGIAAGLPRPINAAVDWKYATALSDKPVFSRAHEPNNVYTPEDSMRGIAESFAFGGSYQYIIANVLQEEDVKRAGVKRYYAFLKENEQYYNGVTEPADVAIFVSAPTIKWYYPDQVALRGGVPQSIQGMAQALAELHIPFNVVVDHQILEDHGYRVIVLPNVACMSDEEAEAIAKFVEASGAIVATGVTSLYDEKYRIRDDFALSRVFGHHHGQPAGAAKNEVGSGRSVYLPGEPEEEFWHEAWPASLQLIEDAIDHALQGDHQLKIDAPNTTVINVAERGDTTLIHLINYDAKLSAEGMAVDLRKPEGKSLGQVTVISPDFSSGTTERIEAKESGDRVNFAVPHLRLYNVVLVEWK